MYLFEREKERVSKRVHSWGEGRRRGRGRISSRLPTVQGAQCWSQSNKPEIMTPAKSKSWKLNPLNHPDTPKTIGIFQWRTQSSQLHIILEEPPDLICLLYLNLFMITSDRKKCLCSKSHLEILWLKRKTLNVRLFFLPNNETNREMWNLPAADPGRSKATQLFLLFSYFSKRKLHDRKDVGLGIKSIEESHCISSPVVYKSLHVKLLSAQGWYENIRLRIRLMPLGILKADGEGERVGPNCSVSEKLRLERRWKGTGALRAHSVTQTLKRTLNLVLATPNMAPTMGAQQIIDAQ